MSGYEDNTRSSQQETSENSSLLNLISSTNILVVDSSLTTLLDMKRTMKKNSYQVTVEADAERALAFLTSCEHEINLVVWDFHMPGINGLEALKIIGSRMDIPVVIMSDESQTESVMQATMYGACDYIMKPVREEIISTIWQHIVRKRMRSKPNLNPSVQPDLAHSNGFGHDKAGSSSKIVDQGQNINEIEENAAKRTRTTWTEENYFGQSYLVNTNDIDQHNDYWKTINQDDDVEQNIEKKKERKARKPRMTWTEDLHQKFLEAIEIVGGIEKANPKLLLECLQDMNVEGLTRTNVSSHLQKYRIDIEERQVAEQMQQTDWSTAYRPTQPSLHGSDNVQTATSSYLMNGQAVNPIQQNQYQNDYLNLINDDEFITDPLPHLPYFDHHLHHHQQGKY